MTSATIVSAMKIQREYCPTCRPKAAPGLYTSVKRSHSPYTSCGIRSGTRCVRASALVQKSTVATSTRTGQNTPELLLCIFLTLLAVDAVARVRQRIEAIERDLVAALVTPAEGFRRPVESPQRLVDVPQEPAFLTREQERLLALHSVGSLISHVERVAAQVAVGGLRRGAERFVGAAEFFEHTLALVEKTLLEMLKHLLVHALGLLRAVGRRHCY